ncbi:helix-turn-helix transcriptional regulator [Amycolatopsis rhizosphaerae]|uniref:Helix-turn-helix transcriptional regulator n=1 Tax=Amycolatopsis rhizosphaerae TaxID=2053003 RepID=A0A558DHT5_9PSEU|nr:helix-turn-helix domain-containing protein [Amycolatopsis rhizosphaerae]TVT60493.1 helix-turn-helix transcriptional regulator [Amycolatopsis rhizosphaerae]
MTKKRDYGQFCGLASAMTVIGERWTLLLIRELLIGPARFHELAENLPGIGPNLLSERLRSLTAAGVVEHAPVPGDGRGRLYQLTAVGEDLRGPVLELARWGLQFLTDADAAGATRAAWGFLAVQAMTDRAHVPQVDEEYEFRVDDEVFTIHVADGTVKFHRGPAAHPVIVMNSDSASFVRIGARMISPFDAIVTGAVKIEGDPEAVHRCTRLLQLA